MIRTGVTAELIVVFLCAMPAFASPLPPCQEWQQAAISGEDVGWDDAVVTDRAIPEASAYVRAMSVLRVTPLESVVVSLADGDGVGPGVFLASDPYAPVEHIPWAAVPERFGPDAVGSSLVTQLSGRRHVVSTLHWRYHGWTVTVSVTSSEFVESVDAVALRLADRQREKLEAAFPTGT
jgi:hypothetical protein